MDDNYVWTHIQVADKTSCRKAISRISCIENAHVILDPRCNSQLRRDTFINTLSPLQSHMSLFALSLDWQFDSPSKVCGKVCTSGTVPGLMSNASLRTAVELTMMCMYSNEWWEDTKNGTDPIGSFGVALHGSNCAPLQTPLQQIEQPSSGTHGPDCGLLSSPSGSLNFSQPMSH